MKQILLFLLDGYADYESCHLAVELNKSELGFKVNTISIEKESVISLGNFTTKINYLIDEYSDFENLAAFILIGGTDWKNRTLVKGYNPIKYDSESAQKIKYFIERCIKKNILVGAICDATTFLADSGFLDNIPHTGNSLSYIKEKALDYKGEDFFVKKQSVIGGNVITANGTASLEFTRDVLLKLNALRSKDATIEWYNFFKKGFYND